MAKLFFAALCCFTLASCSSSSSTPEDSEGVPLTGVFLDSAVAGLSYRTDTQTGTTNIAGEFTYLPGESVTFSIGSVELPTVTASAVVTPLNMSVTGAANDNVTVNVATLLQSLDVDGNVDNGIEISPQASAAATPINFEVSPELFSQDQSVVNLVANSGSENSSLIDVIDARKHLEETVSTFSGSKYLVFTNNLVNADDGVLVSEGNATFRVASDSNNNSGVFVVALPKGNSNSISMKVRFSSESVFVPDGDSRVTISGYFFNGLSDEGVASNDGGVAGDVQVRLSMRNRSDGTRDVLACATMRNVDGSTVPATIETEDGDMDGCAGIGWFFEYDTEYEVGVGVDRSTNEIIFTLNDDVRRYASTLNMYSANDPRQTIWVGARGAGAKTTVEFTAITTDIFSDTSLEELAVK